MICFFSDRQTDWNYLRQLAKTKVKHSNKNITSNIKTVFFLPEIYQVLTVEESHCPICDSFGPTLCWIVLTQPTIHNIHRTGADCLFLTLIFVIWPTYKQKH